MEKLVRVEYRDTYILNRCLKETHISQGTWIYRRYNKPRRWTKDAPLS